MNSLNKALLGVFCALVLVSAAPSVVKTYTATVPTKSIVTVTPVHSAVPEAAKSTVKDAPLTATKALEVIELTSDNMIVMDQVFTDQSVTSVMFQIQALAERVPKGSTVYLVLNTPGGSVPAGLRLFSFIKALPIKVKTLTLFAASMGFQTVQQLGERLILDSGTLMSHRATFGVQGEAGGEIVVKYKWIMSIVNGLDAVAAKRMQMPFAAYQEMIRDEYWVNGQQAVNENAADRMVLAKCGAGLNGTVTAAVETMFGTFNVEMSKCPLIPGFVSVSSKDDSAKPEGLAYVKKMLADKRAFTEQFIITNKWMQFQK